MVQGPTVFLLWLLKELWNYWIYVDFLVMPARASTGVAFGSRRGMCVVGLLGGWCLLARCWVLRQYASGCGV
jgi:hypothetical protein